MTVTTTENQQLVYTISKDIVEQIAPEELEVFDELLEEYFAHPLAANSDDPLAFGSDILVAVTPFVAIAIQITVQFLTEDVFNALKKEGQEAIVKKVKSLFSKPKQEETPSLALDKKQLANINEIIRKEVIRHGMQAKQAEDLALTITARLALAE